MQGYTHTRTHRQPNANTASPSTDTCVEKKLDRNYTKICALS